MGGLFCTPAELQGLKKKNYTNNSAIKEIFLFILTVTDTDV